jgi:hypothetical protein
MGRPLNKKYFGNRNIGTTGTTDDGIGGQGVASVTIDTPGSYTSALPTVSFSTPDIPDGVQATGIVHGNALSAVATAAGTGYNLNNTLTQTAGGTGTMATWNVTGLKVVGITLLNGGTANDVGDEFDFSIGSFATPLRVRVTASNAGVATAVEIVNGGVWVNGTLATDTTVMTRTQVVAGQDMNGQGLQVSITAWGVATVDVVEQGDYTAVSSGAKATTVSPAGGTGATLTITYGISGVEINEKGSGYTTVADAVPTFSGGAAAGTSVLTTDTGDVRSATNQENAIVPYAKTTSGGTSKIAEIIRQVGSDRFQVKTADGSSVCKLKASAVSAQGEMTITATDSDSGTYFVTKISNNKATVAQGTGTQFANGASVKWTFDAADEGYSVKLSNA